MKLYSVFAVAGWMLLGGWMLRGLDGADITSQPEPPIPEAFCGTVMSSHGHSYIPGPGGVDGKALFQTNCASCHNPIKDATGPALKGADGRVPSKEWLYDWIHNPAVMIKRGDAYANHIYKEWGETQMTAFPQLTEAEVDAIVAYVNSY